MTNKEKITKETNEFIKEYLVDPTIDYTTEQIMDSIQKFLVTKGYGIDQFNATVEYITDGGKGVDFTGFLQTEGNSKFAAKLASLNVAKVYSYYATITGFAEPVGKLYDNLSKLENYKNEDGSYTYEGNQLLEDSLYAFIEAVGEGANLIPGGFTFSTLVNEMIPIIGDGIDTIKGEIGEIEISKFEGANDVNFYYSSIYNLEKAFVNGGSWEDGPSLEELEDIYNNCTGTEIFDEYLEWRIQYEFEEKLKGQGIDVEEYYKDLNGDFSPPWWLRILSPFSSIGYSIYKYIKNEIDMTNEIDPISDKVKGKYLGDIKTKTLKASNTVYDPLILDLDGDGFNVETKENGTNFDLDKNDFAEKINWTTKDGFLCLDLNGNGSIDNGGEVFGDQTLLADGTTGNAGELWVSADLFDTFDTFDTVLCKSLLGITSFCCAN